jgi:hypothetical protein
MDVAKLWSEIAHDGHLWALCGVAMALGIVGGIAQAFASADGGRPGWRTLLQRGLLGAVAAGAVLYVATPASGVALVSGSLVAGYAGQALLDALAARAKLQVTKEEAAEAKQQLAAQTKEAAHLAGALDGALRELAAPTATDAAGTAAAHARALAVLRAARAAASDDAS